MVGEFPAGTLQHNRDTASECCDQVDARSGSGVEWDEYEKDWMFEFGRENPAIGQDHMCLRLAPSSLRVVEGA